MATTLQPRPLVTAISAALLALGLGSLPVYAQTESTAPDEAAENEDETITDRVVVTGSRIARDPNLISPAPVQSVDSEDIQLSGELNVIDIVNDLPALLGSDNATSNLATAGAAGAGILNLRNLGSVRTLTLVNGRRHVAGLAGSASVDVNTIPAALVERAEVLTGGASAVYGADAVTGVVNFVLKDDFEGVDITAQYNLSGRGDADRRLLSATFGQNFGGGRGNIVFSLTREDTEGLRQGDRAHTRGDRLGSVWPNPVRFIQAADIAEFGLDPLLLGSQISGFCDDGDSTLGSARDPLCGRIVGVPGQSLQPFGRFNLTSYGSIIGVDWFGDEFLSTFPGDEFEEFASPISVNRPPGGLIFDINNNGIEDCLETVNGTILQRFDFYAGCHVARTPGEGVDVFQDGLLAGSQNAFGGDGTSGGRDGQSITPDDERTVLNLNGRYDITPSMRWFFESKYAQSKTIDDGSQAVQGFFDSHVLRWDNPYIPQNLRDPIEAFVNANPDLFVLENVNVLIGRDMTDMGLRRSIARRDTVRFVTGLEGEIGTGPFSYEVAVNYGKTTADTEFTGLALDRYYAAADAVRDPATGNIVCRSELDPTALPAGSFLRSAGPFRDFQTFTPGQGLCAPINLFGVGAPSQEAIDFIILDMARERTIEQTVVSGFVVGDSSDWFSLPGGPMGMVVGFEYRDEESSFKADGLERPQADPLGIVEAASRVFPIDAPTDNTSGSFDVQEVFAEVSLPLLNNRPWVQDLTLDAAYRYSDYSTLGSTDSWNLRLSYAPIQDIRFRSTLSQTVRAPNINELFSPLQSATARPTDPCDVANINDGTANRPGNCAADGLPADFTDPLTARFSGFTGGNPNLDVETADTFTAGVVLEPRFVPGLSISVDWYDIEIEDAISSIGVQELVNACYDASTFPNQFCEQFQRDRDPNSPTFLGFQSFVNSQLNFSSIVTQGVDYAVRYQFELGSLAQALDRYGSMTLGVTGNWVKKLDRFEDPIDNTIVNDELYENGQPKNALSAFARWRWDRLTLNWQARYWGKFLEFSPRIDNTNADNVENSWTGDLWRHDLSGSYMANDSITIIAGVNNIFDKTPVLSSRFYPVGVVGREYFLGLNARF
ncbi:MAG: TonB-dependent receptor [Wenzhouxiangella sp.]|nr:TonB-dependent receptor [Wenzhouxiangella sp.]